MLGKTVSRLNIAGNGLRQWTLRNVESQSAAGPDGNIWFCGGGDLGKITNGGVVTTYPFPDACGGITAGPDGNLWLLDQTKHSLDKVTSGGAVAQYALPRGYNPGVAIVGSKTNGLLWFCFSTNRVNGVGVFDSIKRSLKLFPLPGSEFCSSIVSGVDGNLYVEDGERPILIRVEPTGSIKTFYHMPYSSFGPNASDVQIVWLADGVHLYGWSINRHTLTSYGSNRRLNVEFPILGPDFNVWFTGGEYMMRDKGPAGDHPSAPAKTERSPKTRRV